MSAIDNEMKLCRECDKLICKECRTSLHEYNCCQAKMTHTTSMIIEISQLKHKKLWEKYERLFKRNNSMMTEMYKKAKSLADEICGERDAIEHNHYDCWRENAQLTEHEEKNIKKRNNDLSSLFQKTKNSDKYNEPDELDKLEESD